MVRMHNKRSIPAHHQIVGVIKCFDISDRANPEESFTHKLTGEYISSRVTDGKLITVAQFRIPYDSVLADDFNGACEVVKDICVPEYSVGDGELKKIPSDRIKVFDEKNPTNYTVTSILNLEDMSAEPKVNAFLGGAEEIYCTREEIFVAETVYMTWTNNEQIVATDDLGNKYETATKVHIFVLRNIRQSRFLRHVTQILKKTKTKLYKLMEDDEQVWKLIDEADIIIEDGKWQ